MAARNKRWYRSRRNQVFIVLCVVGLIVYVSLDKDLPREPDLDITRRESIIQFIENRLQEELKLDKGTGCEIPRLDPFAKEVTQFDKQLPKVTCSGQDWVKCYLSECRVIKEILDTTKDIVCSYRDILYQSDYKYELGNSVDVYGADVYVLTNSDHVKVKCTGKHINSILPSKWTGHCLGFRATVKPKPPPEGREESLNVLIFGFDSTARNGFIRRMPQSYKFLTDELQATVLNGYNIVGDGTPAALFPILTGKNELELPDVRKKSKNNGTLDSMPFIFYKLKEDGYRTAYFEDMPWIGTFQYRFNGFRRQPADHYLRSFFLEESASGKKWGKGRSDRYCVGDTPQYKLMMNITDQFLRLDGKRFCFTFIADITHDDFNMIETADQDFVDFMRVFRDEGRLKDTLLVVMGDHGPRYANVRNTLQGKLEERLPLMAIVLPDELKVRRPAAQVALQANADVLTTPHDVHATILDVMGLTKYWNDYKITGADLHRGMTLLEPIPKNRSCSEAGIEPHWCACLAWTNVSKDDPLYQKTAEALVAFINKLTDPVRSQCTPRRLSSISWVFRRRANSRLLSFVAARDADGYVGRFGPRLQPPADTYQAKIAVAPGNGLYEASLTYHIKEDKFDVDIRDISRTNAYGNEPDCISVTHPHLNMFCYCRK
ncbi:uncharacterized protein LOC113514803 isoform X2 [Galleria mellonella]|uniref:Uncharacterized protein LOC113514803 isoform X2 n=1 Tax=Galleria mellonella TaxID=7137 RepID=A0ABM3M933_GALME|nr:uncharacterized protein LOC113514803 isoform X2 [Galleria mellonella]